MIEYDEEHGERTEEDGERVEIVVGDHGEENRGKNTVIGEEPKMRVCAEDGILCEKREGESSRWFQS